MAKLIKSQRAISPALKLGDDCQELLVELQKVFTFIENNKEAYFPKEKQYRFENGIIPKSLKNWAEDISELSKKSLAHITKLYNLLMESAKDGETQMYLAEPLLAESGFMMQRLENLHALWKMYDKTDNEKGAPLARWIEISEGKRFDYVLSASPIEVGFMLEDNLWSKCDGAVLCSATILALGSFDHFRFQVGLQNNDGTQYQQVNSPFDYHTNAEIIIPNMKYEPSADQFTDEVIERLPNLIDQGFSSLVLFSSYWQMEKVATALRENNKLDIQVQGEQSRQHIIEKHKQNCDSDKQSIIFGTQSFSEGLDLPGKYLNNLIITKLPFSVPTSPVEEAQAEYVSAKGGNPFMSLSVPETSKKLVQATGRLLRNESDEGTITILDRRLVSKRYGKQLLDSLPPYRRTIQY
jgi:ATP-dependent DNA helicase DinG